VWGHDYCYNARRCRALNKLNRRVRRAYRAGHIAQGASRVAWSKKKKFAESQTDSSWYHAVRACENGHVKKTGTLANASMVLMSGKLYAQKQSWLTTCLH
jgi:hypothetical protein